MTLGTILKAVVRGIERESPTILTVLGVSGVVTTAILAVRATPRALFLIEQAKKENDPKKEFTKLDTVKASWKCYIPSALMGVGTVVCIISAHSINLRRNAAIAGLYTVSEAALKEYQEKVVEIIGENKERKIREEIVQDRLDRNPPKEIVLTGKGSTLFYDSWSGRYFESDMEKVKKAQNDLNHALLGGDMYLSLNSFYDELGLERIDGGEEIGWTFDYGMLEVKYTSKITNNGVPCIVIEYSIKPKHF